MLLIQNALSASLLFMVADLLPLFQFMPPLLFLFLRHGEQGVHIFLDGLIFLGLAAGSTVFQKPVSSFRGIILAFFINAKNGSKKTGNLFLISCFNVPCKR